MTAEYWVRLLETAAMYEDEFVKVESLVVKPLVEVKDKLRLRTKLKFTNKCPYDISYLFPHFKGPKSTLVTKQTFR